MGTEYLIDSNAVIDFCNGKRPLAGRELLFSIVQPKISVITHIEVFGVPEISRTEEKILNDNYDEVKKFDLPQYLSGTAPKFASQIIKPYLC